MFGSTTSVISDSVFLYFFFLTVYYFLCVDGGHVYNSSDTQGFTTLNGNKINRILPLSFPFSLHLPFFYHLIIVNIIFL